jgi:hypothetical protein
MSEAIVKRGYIDNYGNEQNANEKYIKTRYDLSPYSLPTNENSTKGDSPQLYFF